MASSSSSLFSFATRILNLRPAILPRRFHRTSLEFVSNKGNVQFDDSESSLVSQNFDNEENTVEDIAVDDTLLEKDFFGVKKLCSPQILFKHKVHYGHKGTALDPGMKQFVYGIRSNQVIFDLDITNFHLQQALNFTSHIALRDGVILFVARIPHSANLIENTAKDCGEYAHTRAWRQGTLTDINHIQGMECRLPDLLIFPSTLSEFGTEHPAVKEAAKLNIPTVGIVDSNCCPNLITYPVPGNDDTPCAIQLYCSLFQEAIMRGKKERARRQEQLENQIALGTKQGQDKSERILV